MTEERTVWHFCKICEKEYSKDIRIHAECLNTFCFECIQTVSQQHSTNLCPYCQFPLPTPLSSLPLNYSLIYWNSLRNSENSTESEEITTNFSKNSSETCSEHNNHFSSYCGECNEAVCTFCILEKHPSHNLILKNEHIENIKKKWQLNVNEAKEENKSVQLFLSRDKSSIVSLIQLEKLNEEINEIETRLQSLIAKRQILMDQTNSLKKNKENINITNQYLNSFIENLPSLPFSSFLPSNYDEINKNNENNNYKNNQNSNSRANLKNFFDKENLSQIYSSIFRKKKSILSPEEKQKRTNFILQEKLILNENLTTNFPVSNCYPHTTLSMDISSKLNLIAVSSQDQIIFYDLSGNILKKFSFQKPNGISILSNHNLIAISSEIEHSVYLFDLVGILNDDQQEIRHEITNGQAIYHGAHLIYDLKYLKKRIGTYQGKGNFLFSSPRGLAFNHEKNILAVSDYGNNQIKFYHLSNEKSKSKSKFSNERPKLKIKFHSLISLSISPKQIALSDSLSQIIIIGDNETISIYKFIENEDDVSWKFERNIEQEIKHPLGISIHDKENYFVVGDQIQNGYFNCGIFHFFNLNDHSFITTFSPNKINSNINYNNYNTMEENENSLFVYYQKKRNETGYPPSFPLSNWYPSGGYPPSSNWYPSGGYPAAGGSSVSPYHFQKLLAILIDKKDHSISVLHANNQTNFFSSFHSPFF